MGKNSKKIPAIQIIVSDVLNPWPYPVHLEIMLSFLMITSLWIDG
jgi:hypothetical protein